MPVTGLDAEDRSPSTSVPQQRPKRTTLAYQPALDGIRGIGLFFVMASHFGYEQGFARGGFLWVSTFFTLSGFLITSLLIKEQRASGTLSMSGFWSRRFRRLMPGALITLAGVIVYGALFADPSQLHRLRGDGLSALFYVANWHFVFGDRAYADLFASPSPVQHFWTLSIEEQFYVVLPLLLIGALAIGARARRATGDSSVPNNDRVGDPWRTVAMIVGALTVAAAAWSAYLYRSGAALDRIYLGTDTRLPELTMGVLLAILVERWRPADRPNARQPLQAVAAISLAIVLVLTVTVHRTDTWLYQGGLALYAMVSSALVLSLLITGGPARWFLSLWPLRWVGQLSYGGYLFHWPLLLVLTPDRVGFDGPALFALVVAITLTLAWASNKFIEHPIRIGARVTGRQPYVVVPAVFAVIVAGFFVVTIDPPPLEVNLGEDGSGSQWRSMPEGEPGTPKVLIVGDSQAFVLGHAIERWGDRTGEAVVWSNALAGCGIVRGGETYVTDEVGTNSCDDWERRWGEALEAFDPDVVMVLSGGWDWIDRKLETWDDVGHYGEPAFDDHLVDEYVAAARFLGSTGATVVWLNSACYALEGFQQDPDHLNNDLIPAMASTVAEAEQDVVVVDFDEKLCPDGEFTSELFGLHDARPDGVHLSDPAADITAEWLGPQLVDAAGG